MSSKKKNEAESKKATQKEEEITCNDIVQCRYDIIFFWDVKDGNPNGDPDAANAFRSDAETGQAVVTPECVKRKLRNIVPLVSPCADGYAIYIGTTDDKDEDRILANKHIKAYKELGIKPGDDDAEEKANKLMCRTYYDVRTFGAVMSTGKKEGSNERHSAGRVTGPVQLCYARSIDTAYPQDDCITRGCVASQKRADEQKKKNNEITGEMGRKSTLAYALFSQKMWVMPELAKKTGFTVDDLRTILKALVLCFGNDRTSSRGWQSFRGAYVFRHKSNPLGNCNDFELFDKITVDKINSPPRNFEDYKINVDTKSIPDDVELLILKNASDVDKADLR